MTRIDRWSLIVGAGALMVLVVSGAWLTRFYRPVPSPGTLADRYPGVATAIGLHRVGAGALLVASGLLLGARLVTSARRGLAPALALVAGVALIITGRRLAWSQLGLRAVKASLDGAGMLFAAFDDIVRFVIVPSVGEMTPADFRLLLGIHTVGVPLLLLGFLLWAQRARERPTAPVT